jgi:TolB protein
VYAIFPDMKKGWQATYTRQLTSGDLSTGWHSWSPDGKWMVMDKSTHEESGYDIYLMNHKTKKTVQLASDAKTEQAPVFVKEKK